MTMPQPNTNTELREQFKKSGLVLEWARFTGANKTMIDEYVDVLVHYANVAIAEARKEEVNRIPNFAYIGSNGERREPNLQYIATRLAELTPKPNKPGIEVQDKEK